MEEKLYAFIGEATHLDSPDGLNQYIVIAEDAPDNIVAECMEDNDDDAIISKIHRSAMDSIAKSIAESRDKHVMSDGYVLDLTEPYIISVEQKTTTWVS